MPAVGTKSLLAGLIAGLCLGLFLQQAALVYLPNSSPVAEGSLGSEPPHHFLLSFDAMLRNSLQMARQAVRAGGFLKSGRVAPSSLPQHQATSIATTPTIASSSSTFSTSTPAAAANMASQKPFLQAVKERRTYYQLNKEAPISDAAITDIVKQAVTHVPSSFNSQSARLVVLLNKEHDTFWDMVLEVLKPMVPAEQFPQTEQRVGGFRKAYGTVSLPFFFAFLID